MARLNRLAAAGHAHLLLLRGQGTSPVFTDDPDRTAFTAALREAAAAERVQWHAHALLATEVRLLVTPAEGAGLSRMVQALGRRYVAGFNKRHGRRGTLWDGRFRGTVVQAGAPVLEALVWVDGASGLGLETDDPLFSSAGHRTGGRRQPALVDPPEYWQLGNTPFEREQQYRLLLADGLSPDRERAVLAAVTGGWALGSEAFARELSQLLARPALPRPRGRPRHRGA